MLTFYAPAKINLHLHVTGRRDDGYHYLDSLVAFTGVNDCLTFETADSFRLDISGEFAKDLDLSLSSVSSVEKAANLLAAHLGRAANVHITLEKNLPLGAGLGGGSADAAASLKALNNLWNGHVPDPELASLALKIGADVPACLTGKNLIMRGIGDLIGPAPRLPELPVVLVWPDCAASTVEVYKNIGLETYSEEISFDEEYTDIDKLIGDLEQSRNDLQTAAVKLFPVIGTAMTELKQLPDCRFVRMSGSGSSVFAIFGTREAAGKAAAVLNALHPKWWIKATQIIR